VLGDHAHRYMLWSGARPSEPRRIGIAHARAGRGSPRAIDKVFGDDETRRPCAEYSERRASTPDSSCAMLVPMPLVKSEEKCCDCPPLEPGNAFPVAKDAQGAELCERCSLPALSTAQQALRVISHFFPGETANVVVISVRPDGMVDLAIPLNVGARRAAEIMHAVGGDMLYALTRPREPEPSA
jgi:hypothetical protein